jgi:urease accessory protein
MGDKEYALSRQGLLRLQSWVSPTFPVGAFSYSHALEWAIQAGQISDRESLLDWLDADLRFGSARNEAIFFAEAWRNAKSAQMGQLFELSELAAAFRSTCEFAVEASQQASAYATTLSQVWPDRILTQLSGALQRAGVQPSISVILGIRTSRQSVALNLALPSFLQSYCSNLVTIGMRLIPLGQTDGQLAIAALEEAVLAVAAEAQTATIEDLGSAAFMIDLASSSHETQQPRLFRT